MRNFRLLLLVSALVMVIAGIYYFRRLSALPDPPPLSAPSPGGGPLIPGAPSNAPSSGNMVPGGPSPLPLRDFLRKEAASLDSTKVDAQEAEARIRAQADAMTDPDLRAARDLVLAGTAPVNERILAAYLLGKGGKKAWPEVREILQAPSKERGGPAHSEAEMKATQEKAIQLMLLDELSAKAATDAAAREELVRLSNDLNNSSLRAYARKKLAALPPL